ncbi:hypothetical protein KUCAC02_004632, partial [Chaenocephalus aceratus]
RGDHLEEGEQKHLSQGLVDSENIGYTSAGEYFWASEDVQGVQVGKSRSITVQTGESWLVDTPPLARHHTLRSQAERSCFDTDLSSAVEETDRAFEVVCMLQVYDSSLGVMASIKKDNIGLVETQRRCPMISFPFVSYSTQ